jgi:pilus assembly protein Flp/PilA
VTVTGNLLRFVRDERGATAIEYALLATLIGVGSIAAFGAFGNGLVAIFGSTETGAGGAISSAANSL